jgi:replicative DNA helicase
VTVLSDGLERLTRPLDGVSIEETLAATEAALMQVLAAGTTHEPQPIGELLPDLLATMTTGGGPRPRIATGFPRLDELTGGLGPGKLIVVAARTSHGKTAFAGSLLLRLAQRGTPVFLASYEMTRAEIMARLIAIRSRVGLSTVEQGHGRREDLDAIVEAANELARWPILLDDRQPPETQLATTIRLQARKRGVKVAIVDYVGLVEPRDRRVLREQQIAGITRTLKRTALETGVCVIALAQLNRGIEHRDDKRPRLADLRESGAIEQDADQVWLLYRPHKDQPDRFDDHAELIVAKNRGGPCGQLALTWNGRLTEYTD